MEIRRYNPELKYDVMARIGSGTYGEVFKVRDRETKQIWAMKAVHIPKEENFESVKVEIDVLNKCRHPNILEICEAIVYQSVLWICLDFCEAGSLNDVINSIGSLPELMIAYVVREALRGIEHLHSLNQLHRDIKAANILLKSNGEIKLADFGISTGISGTCAKRNTVLGTPYWMAPEVVAAEKFEGYGKSCDIWSIGITTIELADQEPPLYQLHPMAALNLIGKSSYRSPTVKEPAKWSSEMNSFIKKTLNKSVKMRPAASDCLNHPFLKNPVVSVCCGTALYKAQLSCKLRNNQDDMPVEEREEALHMLEKESLKQDFINFPPLGPNLSLGIVDSTDTLKIDQWSDPEVTRGSGLCYIWDWRNQVQQSIPDSVGGTTGLVKIQENCDVLCTEMWVNPLTRDQKLLLGTNDGVYLGNLGVLGEFSPVRIMSKPCAWMHVNMYDVLSVMTSVSHGSQLYTLDLHDKSSKIAFRLSRNRHGRIYSKVEGIRDIEKCVAFRYSTSSDDFLLCKIADKIVILQWYLPYRKYMIAKTVGLDIPRSFWEINEPILDTSKNYPFLCIGASQPGPDKSCDLEFDNIDLNNHFCWGLAQDNSDRLNRLEAISVAQLTDFRIFVGFKDWAALYTLEGKVCPDNIITFDVHVSNYVIISDGVLAIHQHGVIAKNYDNKTIQDISDPSRTFNLLGSKGLVILATVDSHHNAELNVLTGYQNHS